MNLIKPKKLNLGDTISIIATSGECDKDKIYSAKSYFECKGYKVKLSKNIFDKNNYLAGNDEDRANAINCAFEDSEVAAIICARGGYGALRIIDKIDYNLIRNNPKIFCGYSDVTILNAMILKRAGLITFSGPMAQSDFSSENICMYTEDKLYKALTTDLIELKADYPKYYSKNITAEGIVFGGNLSTISSLCGTDFVPDEKFIFFTEDLNEPAYKVDRYITQLLNISKFKNNLQAIVLGDFLDIDNNEYFDNLIHSIAEKNNIPIISGFKLTHDIQKDTIPIGGAAVLNGDTITIKDYLHR